MSQVPLAPVRMSGAALASMMSAPTSTAAIAASALEAPTLLRCSLEVPALAWVHNRGNAWCCCNYAQKMPLTQFPLTPVHVSSAAPAAMVDASVTAAAVATRVPARGRRRAACGRRHAGRPRGPRQSVARHLRPAASRQGTCCMRPHQPRQSVARHTRPVASPQGSLMQNPTPWTLLHPASRANAAHPYSHAAAGNAATVNNPGCW